MGFGEALGSAVLAYEKQEADRIKAEKKRVLEESLEVPSPSLDALDGTNEVAGSDMFGLSDQELLDAISKNEGTYKTGYNTEYGYTEGNRERPLSEMSLNDILDYQDTMVDNQTGKLKSSAIGRYQMLSQTIRDEIKHGKYVGDELFTDDLQDSMILQRLNRSRGLDDWRNGEIDDEIFTHNLSKEFASINNPYTGKSYHGQGGKPLQYN